MTMRQKRNREVTHISEDNTYLSHHLSLFAQVFAERIAIGPKSFTYLKNFAFCSFSRVEDNKYIFLSLLHYLRSKVNS